MDRFSSVFHRLMLKLPRLPVKHAYLRLDKISGQWNCISLRSAIRHCNLDQDTNIKSAGKRIDILWTLPLLHCSSNRSNNYLHTCKLNEHYLLMYVDLLGYRGCHDSVGHLPAPDSTCSCSGSLPRPL